MDNQKDQNTNNAGGAVNAPSAISTPKIDVAERPISEAELKEQRKLQKKKELENEPKHFNKSVRLGSRKIVIQQVEKFSLLPNEPQAQAIRDEVIKKIGSKFAKNSRDIIRGLSPEEEKYYLPKYLGISATSNEWTERTRTYWADFTIAVPPEGIEIEAGFHLVENEYGDWVIEPINLDGYIKYNFCLVNNDVANPDIENTYHFMFQMIDKAKNEQEKEEGFRLIKSVSSIFNKLIQSEDAKERAKIDWILEIEGDNGRGIYTSNLTEIQKEMKLKEFMESNPQRFKEVVLDKQLEMKAFVRKAVQTSAIIQDGDSYFLDDKVIGTGMNQAIAFFENQVNQGKKLLVYERIKNFK